MTPVPTNSGHHDNGQCNEVVAISRTERFDMDECLCEEFYRVCKEALDNKCGSHSNTSYHSSSLDNKHHQTSFDATNNKFAGKNKETEVEFVKTWLKDRSEVCPDKHEEDLSSQTILLDEIKTEVQESLDEMTMNLSNQDTSIATEVLEDMLKQVKLAGQLDTKSEDSALEKHNTDIPLTDIISEAEVSVAGNSKQACHSCCGQDEYYADWQTVENCAPLRTDNSHCDNAPGSNNPGAFFEAPHLPYKNQEAPPPGEKESVTKEGSQGKWKRRRLEWLSLSGCFQVTDVGLK